MSFSSELRLELCKRIDRAAHCRIAMLAGIITLDGKMKLQDGRRCMSIRMEKNEVVETVLHLLSMVFGMSEEELEIVPRTQEGARVRIYDAGRIDQIFQTLKLTELDDRLDVDDIVISKSCCRTAFLRGAFLASGSVANPETQYQLEIVTDRDTVTRQVLTAMAAFGAEGHVTERRYSQVVYLKDADGISETLGQLGAVNAMMQFENSRIVKGIRNNINREVNCDTANITKTANAAIKQIEEIRRIESTVGLSALPANLRELAVVRLENPDLSLKELGEMMDPPLGKSGVNHRLRKISEYAARPELLR